MELKDAFEDYHLYLSVVQRKSKRTVQSYLHDIDVYLDFLRIERFLSVKTFPF